MKLLLISLLLKEYIKFRPKNSIHVQTPTVAMIANREDEIKNFKAQTYYGIEAQTTNQLKLTWQDANGNSRSFNKEKIDGIVKGLDKHNATVLEIDKKQKKSFSPGLYDLTELQRDANKKVRLLCERNIEYYAEIV